MTPEEQRKVYPKFIADELERSRNDPDWNERPNTKITDFFQLIRTVWIISNKSYQEQHWGKYGQWGDNFSETDEEFSMWCEAVFESKTGVEMTPKQREMLAKLFQLFEDYAGDQNTPISHYGENDQAIINDPRWQEITKYARLVYEELSGDDLDAWEKERDQRNAQDGC